MRPEMIWTTQDDDLNEFRSDSIRKPKPEPKPEPKPKTEPQPQG